MRLQQSSGCVGGCVKPPPLTPSDKPGPRKPRSSKRRVRVRGHTARPPRTWWSTSSNDMEISSALSARSFQNFPIRRASGNMASTTYSNQGMQHPFLVQDEGSLSLSSYSSLSSLGTMVFQVFEFEQVIFFNWSQFHMCQVRLVRVVVGLILYARNSTA